MHAAESCSMDINHWGYKSFLFVYASMRFEALAAADKRAGTSSLQVLLEYVITNLAISPTCQLPAIAVYILYSIHPQQ